jgi:hypothetical protein
LFSEQEIRDEVSAQNEKEIDAACPDFNNTDQPQGWAERDATAFVGLPLLRKRVTAKHSQKSKKPKDVKVWLVKLDFGIG